MPRSAAKKAPGSVSSSPSKQNQKQQAVPGSPPTVVKKRRQPAAGGRGATAAAANINAQTLGKAVAAGLFGHQSQLAVVHADHHRLPLPDGSELTSNSWPAVHADMGLIVQSMENRKGAEVPAVRELRQLYEAASTAEKGAKVASVEGRTVVNVGKLHTTRRKLCESFAANCKKLEADAIGRPGSDWQLPPPLLTRLLDLAYAKVVTEPKSLNKYKPFSHEVYGETNYELTHQIITEPWAGPVGPDDVFIDLGSGVGQVVLQAAATTGCRAYGIELMPAPAGYAEPLRTAFEWSLGKWGYRMNHAPGFVHGSFLEDHGDRLPLVEATFIFVNNYAFPVGLSQQVWH